MKQEKHDNSIFPSFEEIEQLLKKPIELPLLHPDAVEFSDNYLQFLQSKLSSDSKETVGDMISGKEMSNDSHNEGCSYTWLRHKVHECLDMDNTLIIELARDCSHRLDDMDHTIEEKILNDTLTASEYIRVKRSFNVIRIILLIIHSRLDREEKGKGAPHPLRAHTKSSLKKIVAMTRKVDKHLGVMLDAVNRKSLRADPTAWLAAAVVLLFGSLYVSSFFALDKEHSAAEQIYYFLGIR